MKKPEILLHQKVPDSSNIKHVAYQPALQIMQILFVSGRIYWYYKIPRSIYDGLINSESKGKYFWENIKSKYTYKRIKSI